MKITRNFVLFKLPNQTEFTYWSLGNQENEKYFVFHSFDNKTTRRLFYKSELKLSFEEVSKLQIDLNLNSEPENLEESYQNYIQKCNFFIDALKKKELDKVILSRMKLVDLPQNLAEHLVKLGKKYPSAMIYLANFDDETWMGASPEKLVQIQNNQLTTVALASTKAISENREWTEKERKEHQLVVDYIADNLSKFSFNIEETKTIDLGELQHLKTEFSANIDSEVSIEKISNLLHPTPAVCGMPKKKAHEFILENENYDRSFYTGYFGLVSEKNSEIYVNLRCAQLFENKMAVYVGGGLLAESIPENEWQETELKSRALM